MKIILKNKKAYHEYEILEKFEAGLCLLGTEVKSLREGRVNFKDSYCKFKKNELFLTGANISAYSHAKFFNHDPERERKLLMHKRELRKLASKVA
jgi:SsrA-binding protein